MNNKGKITIFLTLLLSAVLLLGITALNVASLYVAKGKAAMAAKSAVSGVKASYNSYIFEHYHILLFDKNANGRGEGYLEEQCMRDMDANIPEGCEVSEVSVSEYELLMDNDCLEFKRQIEDYMKYAAVEYGVDNILSSTGGKDGTLPEEAEYDFENNEGTSELQNENETDNEDTEEIEDPREFTAHMTDEDITGDIGEASYVSVDMSELPSKKHDFYEKYESVNRQFDDEDICKKDLENYSSWGDKLIDGGTGVAYAKSVFNSRINSEKNTDSVLRYEMEYLVCGEDSDRKNFQGAMNRIIAIRFPINYAFLISDPQKNSQITTLAVPLAAMTLTPPSVVKHLIAGCWAYVEAVAEARNLAKGKRLPFTKNNANWLTDLDNLGGTIDSDAEEDIHGLDYEDYLMILMAVDMDKTFYRMLDIMQINARQENSGFYMKNAATGLVLDSVVRVNGHEIKTRTEEKY